MAGGGGAITFKVLTGSSGCGDEGGHTFTIHLPPRRAQGDGEACQSEGHPQAHGVYSHDDGSFTVKVSGTLTK